MDGAGKEVVRAGKYFGEGLTNNEAESLALKEAMQCLVAARNKASSKGWELDLPVQMFGDSQLIIRHLTGIFKKPGKPTIWETLNGVRKAAAKLPHVVY